MSEQIKIFIAYARKDEKLLEKFRKALSPIIRVKNIEIWYDGVLMPGEEWDNEIKNHLNDADIILLMISPDSIHSKYFYEEELKRAIERHQNGEAIVVPVILRPCKWTIIPILKDLQAVPKNAKAITRWSNRDLAYHDAVGHILNRIENLEERQKKGKEKVEKAIEEAKRKEDAEQARKLEKAIKEAKRKEEAEEEQKNIDEKVEKDLPRIRTMREILDEGKAKRKAIAEQEQKEEEEKKEEEERKKDEEIREYLAAGLDSLNYMKKRNEDSDKKIIIDFEDRRQDEEEKRRQNEEAITKERRRKIIRRLIVILIIVIFFILFQLYLGIPF